jgi:hypothetical protein
MPEATASDARHWHRDQGEGAPGGRSQAGGGDGLQHIAEAAKELLEGDLRVRDVEEPHAVHASGGPEHRAVLSPVLGPQRRGVVPAEYRFPVGPTVNAASVVTTRASLARASIRPWTTKT